MRVCIVGAGAVGGHLAAKLGKAGQTIGLLARGAHLEAIRRDGLRLESGSEVIHVRPQASADPRELGPQDVVFVTSKANSLAALAPILPPLLGPDTPVVFAQNGVPWWYFHRFGNRPWRRIERLDPSGELERAVGLERVIGCIVYSSNMMVAPGVLRSMTPKRNRFALGEPAGGTTDRVERLAKLFDGTGLEVPVEPAIRQQVWGKLLTNMGNSAACCLTGGNIGQALSDPEVVAVGRAINVEAAAIARSHGIEVTPGYTPEAVQTTLGSPVAGHKPSMMQDLEAGKPMEIDAQFLVPRDFAREAGIATPVLDTVAALLKAQARLAGCYEG
jgi:2-dehydropantoate 2-reductase